MSIANLANRYVNIALTKEQRYDSFYKMIEKLQEIIDSKGSISFNDWNRVNFAHQEMYSNPSYYGYGENKRILSPIKNKINNIRRATVEKEQKNKQEHKKRRANTLKSVRNEHPKYEKMFKQKHNKRILTAILSMNEAAIPRNVQRIIIGSAILNNRADRVKAIKSIPVNQQKQLINIYKNMFKPHSR